MSRRLRLALTSTALAALASGASGQSFNIDFGSDGPAPSSAYGAAGEAGEWNVVPALSPGNRVPLVDVDGTPTGADIRQVGGSELIAFDDPATAGEDGALLDDMFISHNDPLDVCIWIDNIENGRYEVLTYALTPGDPDLESRVRVDFADQGPVMIGGAWPGSHVEGISYARHTVDVDDNEIGLHSGLPSGLVQSGINGIQISRIDLVGVGEATDLPVGLLPNVYPNPFRTRVTIELRGTGGPGIHRLEVLDVTGRLVRALAPIGGEVAAIVWDGRDAAGLRVPAGVYFVRALGNGTSETRKLVRHD